MKNKFSTKWKGSRQPRKQRKYLANAPLHLKRKMMAAMLDKVLRNKYGMRNIEVKKGDTVKVMRGKMSKKQGKVADVDLRRMKVSIEGLQAGKKDGSKVNVWFHPSNLKIMILDLEDGKRMKRKKDVKVEEKKVEEKKEEKKESKVNKEKKNVPEKTSNA